MRKGLWSKDGGLGEGTACAKDPRRAATASRYKIVGEIKFKP
jgi:hypothetical protein